MIKRIIIAALLLLPALTAVAQEDACAEKGGTWNADDSTCNLHSSLEMDIQYPLELTQHEIVTQTVDAFVQQTRDEFLSAGMGFGLIVPASFPFTLSVTYEEYPFSDSIDTLVFTVGTYTGGAHPNSYFKTFTFDLDQETEISLDDVLQPDALSVIAPIVMQDLQTQIGEYSDATMIESGAGTNPANYQNFAITPDALIFFFSPYQVAPYVVGSPEVHIPLADINNLLTAPFSSR